MSPDRRRHDIASRFYRFTMRREVYRPTVLAMVLGWLLMIYGELHGQIAQTAQASGGASGPATVEWTSVGGGFLLFMAVFAGISRWVAKPAARDVLAEHLREKGSVSHRDLVSREEWDVKHNKLLDQLNTMERTLAALVSAINARTGKRT